MGRDRLADAALDTGATGAISLVGSVLGVVAVGASFAVWAASRLLETPASFRALLALAPAPVAAAAIFALPPPAGAVAAATAMAVTSYLALRFGRILVAEDLLRFERVGIPGWLRSVLAIPIGGAS